MAETKKSPVMELEEETIEKVFALAKAKFDDYLTQREEDIDERYALSDWMYKTGQSRAQYNVERKKFIPRTPEGQSQVGSSIFHRQVNQMASSLAEPLLSDMDWFKYADKQMPGNPTAAETGTATGEHLTALAKWCMKADEMKRKVPEFATSVFKQSNIFAQISMKREEKTVWYNDPTPIPSDEVDETGNPVILLKPKLKKKTGEAFNYPSITFPYPQNIYADKYIPTIENQECVVILSQTTKTRLMAEGKNLDQEAIAQIDMESMEWDGTYGADGKNAEAIHADREEKGQTPGIMLRWDAYMWLPFQNGELVEELTEDPVEMELYWLVFVGNSLDPNSAVCVKAITGFDPNNEIPLKEIRATPDDSDMLYHTFISEVIRSLYAADCGLMNTAIDNAALINDPPMSIIDGMHRIKDFTFKHGQRWHVDTHDALKPYDVRDNTMQTVALREQVRQDVKQALATDDPTVGEYAGARTSATEFMGVSGHTQQPIKMRNMYILQQLLPWMAKKYAQYIRAYMKPAQIRKILNEDLNYGLQHDPVIGEYDLEVDIIQEYEDDQISTAKLNQLMQIVASNPALMQSETHQIDMGELMKAWMEKSKLPAGKIIKAPMNADSEANARQRVNNMLLTGVFVPPVEGENVDVHLRVARAEKLRWSGLEGVSDPRVPNLPLIDQYIEALKGMGGAAPQGGAPVAEQTPGQEQGNEMASQLGAMMGGIG